MRGWKAEYKSLWASSESESRIYKEPSALSQFWCDKKSAKRPSQGDSVPLFPFLWDNSFSGQSAWKASETVVRFTNWLSLEHKYMYQSCFQCQRKIFAMPILDIINSIDWLICWLICKATIEVVQMQNISRGLFNFFIKPLSLHPRVMKVEWLMDLLLCLKV